MKHRTMIATLAAAAAAVSLAGGAVALADSGDSGEGLTGPAATSAGNAALEQAGGQRVQSVERDTEHGATWSVEVVQPDGSTLEVWLDRDLQVITTATDDDANESGDREQ